MKKAAFAILKWSGSITGVCLMTKIITTVLRYRKIKKIVNLQEDIFRPLAEPFPVEEKYIFKSAYELAEMIRKGRASSLEVVQEHINHIKNNNWKVNALVWLYENDALEAARHADEEIAVGKPAGLLHGVPVTVKEHFWVKGKPTNVNDLRFAGFKAPRNGAMVNNLLAEGAIIIGSTNNPEMLLDYQTHGQIYPTASNPFDFTRTPGGSTGGGAAAVASGFSPADMGSDAVGSLRVPAAFCGLYALKVTEKTLDLFDANWPASIDKYLFREMAVPGPITRSVDDLELMWNALRRNSPYNNQLNAVKPPKKLSHYRIAWIDDWGKTIYTGRDVKSKMNKLISNLEGEGVLTFKDAPDLFEEMSQMAMLLASYSWFLDPHWITRKFSKAGLRMMKSKRLDPLKMPQMVEVKNKKNYQAALARRQELIERTEEFFHNYDFLITPITAGPAIEKGPMAYKIKIDDTKMHYWDYFAYGQVFNATGHPAISIPLGFSQNGLPIGVQVIGKYYSEKELLHFARLIEPLHLGYSKPTSMIREYVEKSPTDSYVVS